jgi:hypothetical protein
MPPKKGKPPAKAKPKAKAQIKKAPYPGFKPSDVKKPQQPGHGAVSRATVNGGGS